MPNVWSAALTPENHVLSLKFAQFVSEAHPNLKRSSTPRLTSTTKLGNIFVPKSLKHMVVLAIMQSLNLESNLSLLAF